MDTLLKKLIETYPAIRFTRASNFCWSPATRQIFYNPQMATKEACWSLLHELGHALLDHQNYTFDFELVEIEVSAWEKAQTIAVNYDITIDKDHIENCIDSYRDWLYRRASCPECSTNSLQIDQESRYQCFNCDTVWSVSSSRFCRPYRQAKQYKKSPKAFALGDPLNI